MRRTAMAVVALVVAAPLALVAGSSPGAEAPPRESPARLAPAVRTAARLAIGPSPVPEPVTTSTATPAPAGTLDLLLSLERPAGPDLRRRLDRLGMWSWAFSHVPVAAVRLPAGRLEEARRLEGVLSVHLNQELSYLLDESAALLGAPRVWDDLGVTGKGVTVAVIDTGVDFTHPDLAPALVANVKLVGMGRAVPPTPVEETPNSDTSAGHGTHVAGDVAGRGIASDGTYRGLAPGAGLVGIGAGDGVTLDLYTVVQAYDWIIEHRERLGIRVVNNSFGNPFTPFDPENPIHLATRAATDAGLLVVFANGNDGDEMTMNGLAVAPWVLAVGAATKTGEVAGFSSAGIEADQPGLGFDGETVEGETRRPLHLGLYHPDVLAPGQDIVSTRAPGTVLPLAGAPRDASLAPGHIPRYTTMSGTSMAAPVAAGVAALVMEANPALGPAEVRRVLQATARPLPAEPFHRQGYGLLDAAGAVELALDLGPDPGVAARRLEERQAARDAEVLATLAHPTRTAAWADSDHDENGVLRHPMSVPAGTTRLKVVTNGVSVPFLGLVEQTVVVRDATGVEVGRATGATASGTTVADLDLHNLAGSVEAPGPAYDTLTWGTWAIEIIVGDDLPEHPFAFPETATVAAIFAPDPAQCAPSLVDAAPVSWRFQDDDAAGLGPYPFDPEFTFVGPIPGGTLGNRTPERRLAGNFGGVSGMAAGDPVFSTAPLDRPLTLGGVALVELWMQGPGDAVTGVLWAELLDLAPGEEGGEPGAITVLARSGGGDPGLATTAAPERSEVSLPVDGIVTIPAGHRLGVRLQMAFLGTSGHTLLYDSERYPSGLTVVAGRLGDCPPAKEPASAA